jgi:hypothetical protein
MKVRLKFRPPFLSAPAGQPPRVSLLPLPSSAPRLHGPPISRPACAPAPILCAIPPLAYFFCPRNPNIDASRRRHCSHRHLWGRDWRAVLHRCLAGPHMQLHAGDPPTGCPSMPARPLGLSIQVSQICMHLVLPSTCYQRIGPGCHPSKTGCKFRSVACPGWRGWCRAYVCAQNPKGVACRWMGCIQRWPNDMGVTTTVWFLPVILCRSVVIHCPPIMKAISIQC